MSEEKDYRTVKLLAFPVVLEGDDFTLVKREYERYVKEGYFVRLEHVNRVEQNTPIDDIELDPIPSHGVYRITLYGKRGITDFNWILGKE